MNTFKPNVLSIVAEPTSVVTPNQSIFPAMVSLNLSRHTSDCNDDDKKSNQSPDAFF